MFRLLTEPTQLVRWWPDLARLEPRLGGRVRLVFADAGRAVSGRVTRFEPPRAFAFTWAWEQDEYPELAVEFEIVDVADGRCEVRVRHRGWPAPDARRRLHEIGWAHLLGRLADLAEGRPVDKTFPMLPRSHRGRSS